MTEKEILEKIGESAEQMKVPERIMPEQIEKKLRRSARQKRRILLGSAAAALAVAIGAASWYGRGGMNLSEELASAEYAEEAVRGDGGENLAADNRETTPEHGISAEADTEEKLSHKKQDAGELYLVAENYGEVYDRLKKNREEEIIPEKEMAAVDAGGAMFGKSIANHSMAESAVRDTAAAVGSGVENGGFSKTNVQMEGVDESDMVKTDGSYLYTVSKNRVVIADIRNGALKKAGEIGLSMQSSADRILELYVDGKTLNLVVQKEDVELAKDGGTEDVYSFEANVQTEVQTYDISKPEKPVLVGSVTQDGAYQTSRKIGDVLYLFTNTDLRLPKEPREQAVTEHQAGGWIPIINGRAAAADAIYLGEQGQRGLVLSSIDVKKPYAVVDNTVILHNCVDIYVSTEAFYLYRTEYSERGSVTQIAKFGMKQGVIDAVGAAAVNGSVRDTFAVNEYRGNLRVLTTTEAFDGGKSGNHLYLFDKKMNLTGKIEGMAAGEQIYAARYFGDTAYFVTYRNTDPLFAVDLSNAKNPKILDELKITGFSEYLHFWGEEKLVGIGCETDPDSGRQLGIKVTMFDISNPADLKEIKSLVLKDADYSEAFYQYKCVLADEKENLLGFPVESYARNSSDYVLFSWENGKFKNLLTEHLGQNEGGGHRGIYVGNVFYLVNENRIASFDREEGYRLIATLEL